MRRSDYLRMRPAVTLVAAVGLALCGTQAASASTARARPATRAHQTIPVTATFAAPQEFQMLALMQMGYEVKCAVTNNGTPVVWPTGGDGSPPGAATIAAADHTQVVGGGVTNGFDYDELAQCAPNYVIGSDTAEASTSAGDIYPTITPADIAADNATANGMNDNTIAPTLWTGYSLINYGDGYGATTGPVQTLWKGVFMDFAIELQNQGLTDVLARAEDVLTLMDLRAAALRGQVHGVGIVEFEASPTSWGMGNDYFPEDSMFYGPDLGMNGIILPAADYNTGGFDTGCVPPAAPKDCFGSGLSDESYYIMDPANVLVGDISPVAASAMKADPLFQDIPAVKAGHFVLDPGEIRLGGLTAAFDYGLVEQALKITEYHTTVSGSPGATASVTLDPSTSKLCYAVDPTAGSLPADSITLKGPPVVVATKKTKKGKKSKKSKSVPLTVVLAKKASYVNPEPLPQWNTTPTTYQAAGCVKLSKSVEALVASKPKSFSLEFGSGSGSLVVGALNVVYGS